MMNNIDYKAAHKHSSKHRSEILASEVCGCFFCMEQYGPDEIKEWIDKDETALCPKCQIDSVIGTASGFPITDEFLREMRQR